MNYLKLLSIVALSSIVLASCNPPERPAGDQEGTESAATAEKKEVLVRTQTLEKTTISRTIDYNSTLQAWEEVYIAPASPGRIQKIYVEPGDRVKKGQKLFLMDQTQVHQSRIQLNSLEVDLNRMEELLLSGSITQQAYDQLKTQYDVAKTSLAYLEENTVLYAPFSGIITGKYYEDGEMFSGAPNTQAGKAAIVTLMQINPLKSILNISENYYPMVKDGMEAKVSADVFDNQEFPGEVILVYPTIDAMTRSFKVELEVPNNANKLKPGMFTRVAMFVGEEEAFVVPSNTVLQQEGTNIRYLFAAENGSAKRYNVILGKRFDEKIEIISDENLEGLNLIVEGHKKLMNGDKVKVVK